MAARVTAVDCGVQRVLAALRRDGERYERAREDGKSGRGTEGMKSNTAVSLADASEITSSSGYSG